MNWFNKVQRGFGGFMREGRVVIRGHITVKVVINSLGCWEGLGVI